jgi:hypothetical protein
MPSGACISASWPAPARHDGTAAVIADVRGAASPRFYAASMCSPRLNAAMRVMSRGEILTTLKAGLIAGTIDIGAASLIYGLSPIVILKAIAGGLLGAASFKQGLPAALLGLLLQWLMSSLIALFFVLFSRRLGWLKHQWLVAGLVYGVVIFFVMNYAVVPLSAIRHMPSFTLPRFVENLLAVLVFAVVISAINRRARD